MPDNSPASYGGAQTMIRTETVFVLGAGASEPYGFPTSATLRRWICDSNLRKQMLVRPLADKCGIKDDLTLNFCNAFHNSAINSIDAFLAKRSEYTDIGKK